MTATRTRLGATVAATAALLHALTTAAPAATAGPPPVDPASVTPALNANFAPWTCWEAGSGITCQGSWYPEYENEPIGLQCDGHAVHVSGSGTEFMTRWHTADGRATRTVVHLDYPGDRYSLSPTGDGPSVTIGGHWNRHYVYTVPGDVSSRILTEAGAIYLGDRTDGARLHGSGVVTYAAGEDFETVTDAHGLLDHIEDPASVDTYICDALT